MIKITGLLATSKIKRKVKEQFDLFNDGYLVYAERRNEKLVGRNKVSEAVLRNNFTSLFIRFDISHLIPGILKF